MAHDKKLTERTFSGFLYLITGSGLQIVLKIGVLAILARLVSPKEFGVMGLALVILELSKMFTQMGVGPAIVQRPELEERHLTTGFTLSILMGLLFSSMLLLGAPLIALFFKMEGLVPVIRAISLVFLVDSFTLIGQALLQRNMQFKTSAMIELASYAVGYGAVGIVLGKMGWGVWALVAANISQAVINALLLLRLQPFPKRLGFDKDAFRELIYFGGGMTMGRIGNFLATQGDNLVIGRTLGPVALGIYGRAYQFMVMPASLFGNALDKALFPAMAKVQGDTQKIGKAFLTGVSMIALLAMPLSVVLVLLAPEIVLTLLGRKWVEVILPFQILACSLLFRMSYKLSDTLARATGAVYQRAWRQIIYAGLVFIGAIIGHYWGLYGVATGIAVALTANFFMMAQLSTRLAGISWASILKVHQEGFLLMIPMGLGCYLLTTLCRSYDLHPALRLTLVGTGLAAQLYLMLRFFHNYLIRNDLKELFHHLIVKKFKKSGKVPKNGKTAPDQIVVPNASTAMSSSTQPDTTCAVVPLPTIQQLLTALHQQNIVYCHWKSNEHLDASMTGDTDLDILFHHGQKEQLELVLADLGFKNFKSIKEKQYKDIEDYIALDVASGKVIHVHAHFRLTMGETYLKGYQLQIEDNILNTRVYDETFGIYRSDPAIELILLYIREALKLRNRDVLMMGFLGKTQYSENVLKEYRWLKERTTSLEMEAFLAAMFKEYGPMLQIMNGGFTKKQLLKLSFLVRKEFESARLYSPVTASLVRWYREITVKFSRKFAQLLNRPIISQRVNPRGGMVIAVIGADGSGKSTVTANLRDTFQKKLDVYRIYYGRGDGKVSWPRKMLTRAKGAFLHAPKKSASGKKIALTTPRKKGTLAEVYRCINALMVANEKRRNLQWMQVAKEKGMLIICDRYPQNQIMGYNDGPLLHHLADSKNPVFRMLSKMEANIYAKAESTPPDVIFKLIAEAEVVEARKPGETLLATLEAKIAGFKSLQFKDTCKVITVDATQPLDQVLSTVKKEIWQAYH
ncbi:oligosaccharide flippase family protein [Nibribacter ruber]|uniref:Oligosaccharide flippase family protein n=1 Tax=Nibribacter ruber TaxID=2698458 RepID=A0A6P1P384_9BACT|nr:oligosaccharide flippase family protein [Nibribacter ruber]QHL88825.1 oligosaccharide flippase family protein [Nibribacter ruber]